MMMSSIEKLPASKLKSMIKREKLELVLTLFSNNWITQILLSMTLEEDQEELELSKSSLTWTARLFTKNHSSGMLQSTHSSLCSSCSLSSFTHCSSTLFHKFGTHQSSRPQSLTQIWFQAVCQLPLSLLLSKSSWQLGMSTTELQDSSVSSLLSTGTQPHSITTLT